MLGLEDKQAPNGKYETGNQRRTSEETKEKPEENRKERNTDATQREKGK